MEVTKAGRYVGTITKAEAVASDSGAVMLYFDCDAEYYYDGGQWVQCHPGSTIRGSICLVRRDGQVQADTVENIAKATGWSGETAELVSKRVQVQVKEESYRDEIRFRAVKMFPPDAPVAPAGLDPLVAMQIKAIARKATGAGIPAPPAPVANNKDDIPF